jgi:hypothetical protein
MHLAENPIQFLDEPKGIDSPLATYKRNGTRFDNVVSASPHLVDTLNHNLCILLDDFIGTLVPVFIFLS